MGIYLLDSKTTIAPMRVLDAGVYRGRHIFGTTPMIWIRIDLGTLEAWDSSRIPGFILGLVRLLPGLKEHGCSYQTPGGFVRRLMDGTWMGHVVEHVALELQWQAGLHCTRGKTRSVQGAPGVYDVMFAYEDEEVGLLAGRLALQLVAQLLPLGMRTVQALDVIGAVDPGMTGTGPFDLAHAMTLLESAVRRTALGPTTLALVREALRRRIPVIPIDDSGFIQLGHGRHQVRMGASITGRTSQIACDIAGDKHLTKMLLMRAGVPVAPGVVAHTAEEAIAAAAQLGYPLVVKPLDANQGRGVSTGLTGPDEIRAAVAMAQEHGSSVVVERQLQGNDYRILVINGEVVAVAQRIPAHVVGDGVSTITALIEQTNRDPRRGDGHEGSLTRIVIDEATISCLARAGLTPESVPAEGQHVAVKATANLSTGGTAVDRTDDIHPSNAAMARRAALTIGLDVAGIDFITTDISCPARDTGGGVIEINAAPGFRMHLDPDAGWARDVARPTIEMLFPCGAPTRIPIFAVTGTNGKSTTCRMLADILRESGLTVGMTSTNGIYIDGERVAALDASGPQSARLILRDPTVDAAVLETARGGILREGLGYDYCNVGAVLNVAEDHIGLEGVHSIEDLAGVKALVVESVHPDGFSILNADDPLVAAMARRSGGAVVYFTMRGDALSDQVSDHVRAGGLAVAAGAGGNGTIVVYRDGQKLPLMAVNDIPAALNGSASFIVANALAAIAMTTAYGVSFDMIRGALRRYTSSFEQMPGRLNIHDAHGFRVILDYAHNPAGLTALGDVITRLRPGYGRCIGIVSIPGDRRDADIREMGQIAAGIFDDLVFREDPDRRGRANGEINALLIEGALGAGFPRERIRAARDEDEAADVCLRSAKPGDLLVLTATDVEHMWHQVLAFRPLAKDTAPDVAAPAGTQPESAKAIAPELARVG